MNVGEIIADWLKSHNCDGLCNIETPDGCGCGLDDLICCGFINLADCQAARKCEPDEEQKANGCIVAYAPVDL